MTAAARHCADVRTFRDLGRRIERLPGPRPVLVAIDGPGGSGKSTFAERLSTALGGAPIVPTDDFASADTPLEWWPRLLSQVIEPLIKGRQARYQRYDWVRRGLADWVEVPAAPAVILEGVSSGGARQPTLQRRHAARSPARNLPEPPRPGTVSRIRPNLPGAGPRPRSRH